LVQHKLERFYELERAPDVVEFVRVGSEGSRESLVLRQSDDELEIALFLPPVASAEELHVPRRSGPSDAYIQLMEGVSHFVYVAERARTNLPATKLELELQAEVDKFVLMAFSDEHAPSVSTDELHGHLYERVRYLHAPDTEDGVRYRLANDLAARFVARLAAKNDSELVLRTLKRFYRAGQSEKIHLARAA
jgi:hypothetical protein